MNIPRPEILKKPFTGKDEYLAWRTAWRTHYKEVSETIRLLRNLRKPPFRFWQKEEDFRKCATAFFKDQSKSLEAPTLALLEKYRYSVTNVYHKVGKAGSTTTITTGLEPVATNTHYWPGYDTIKFNLRVEAKRLMAMRTNSKCEAQHQYLELRQAKQAKEDRERALARPAAMS